jgi:HPt (histidine-containing phosphotransfer) domain-containing protein
MDDFLTKPMRRQQLADALRGVLRGELGPAGTARADSPPSSDLLEPATLQELREMGPGFTRRVLPGFLRNAPAAAAAITAATALQDMVEVARLAHKFKGSSATLAGHRLAATCTQLEQAAKRGDLVAVTALSATVEQQTEATCAALSTALAVPAAP